MDREFNLTDIIHEYNLMNLGEISNQMFIKKLLYYFDKNTEIINQNDNKVIRKIVNEIGVPQYYDMLHHADIDDEEVSMDILGTLIKESSFHYHGDKKYHVKQMDILSNFEASNTNRFFLTAPTTFGKTFVVYEIIRKMKYKNICLILPTIALLSENMTRLFEDETLEFIKKSYSIHSLSNADVDKEKSNFFIFTPERYLSFRDSNELNFDFVFIDEAYKMDNTYIVDQVQKENERDIAYRLCIHDVCQYTKDLLFAGPYIEFFDNDDRNSKSFNRFLKSNEIRLLNYNDFELVIQELINVKTAKKITIDELEYELTQDKSKSSRFLEIANILNSLEENILVYCSHVHLTEKYGADLLGTSFNENFALSERLSLFVNHLESRYSNDWILTKMLRRGIAIHHGLIPKYIQKEIIKLFNLGDLSLLLCTTTITEGVNTTAKNMIVLHQKKGPKQLRKFDAKNIAGRAGRFIAHFKGRVIIIQNGFSEIYNSVDIEGIKHKNFDDTVAKDEIDVFITDIEFLNESEVKLKEDLIEQATQYDIPDILLESFKSVKRTEKYGIFNKVDDLDDSAMFSLKRTIQYLGAFKGKYLYKEGIEQILDIISPYFKDKLLVFLQEKNVLQFSLMKYMKRGYSGILNYHLYEREQTLSYNNAIRETSKIVFRAFKYELVKLLGVFDISYRVKVYRSDIEKYVSVEEVPGFAVLMSKLEYNALTELGMKASDYGVPRRVLGVIELEQDKAQLDAYEELAYIEFAAVTDLD